MSRLYVFRIQALWNLAPSSPQYSQNSLMQFVCRAVAVLSLDSPMFPPQCFLSHLQLRIMLISSPGFHPRVMNSNRLCRERVLSVPAHFVSLLGFQLSVDEELELERAIVCWHNGHTMRGTIVFLRRCRRSIDRCTSFRHTDLQRWHASDEGTCVTINSCRNICAWPHDSVTELLLSIADIALDLCVHVADVDSPSPVELQYTHYTVFMAP